MPLSKKELFELAAYSKVLVVLGEPEKIEKHLKKLGRYFCKVLEANGIEQALHIFSEETPQMVIVDDSLGVKELRNTVKILRKLHGNLPIIATVSELDSNLLSFFTKQGVGSMLLKPLNIRHLFWAIRSNYELVVKQESKMTKSENELQLLKRSNDHHMVEQTRAFKKEENLIKDDCYMQTVVVKEEEFPKMRWYYDVYYRPLEVLSGDCYSTRRLSDGSILFFVVDAMGKGLSASITSILTTTFINHHTIQTKNRGYFFLSELIRDYIAFIKQELLEDETVSILFALFHPEQERLKYISFGMPSALAVTTKGKVVKIKNNNPPLMGYTTNFTSDDISTRNFSRMLFYTDGLNEATVGGNEIYGKYLGEDFKKSHSLRELQNLHLDRIDEPEDDIAIIGWFREERSRTTDIMELSFKSSSEEINNIRLYAEAFIAKYTDKRDLIADFEDAVYEVAMNSYEHGNLGVNKIGKQKLLGEGKYFETLKELEREHGNSEIKVIFKVSILEDNIRVEATVKDQGIGFDLAKIRSYIQPTFKFHGRGIKVVKSLASACYYEDGGKIAHIHKLVPRGKNDTSR